MVLLLAGGMFNWWRMRRRWYGQGIFSLALGKINANLYEHEGVWMSLWLKWLFFRDFPRDVDFLRVDVSTVQLLQQRHGFIQLKVFVFSKLLKYVAYTSTVYIYNILYIFLWHPIILSENEWCVQSPPKRIAFGFHEIILRRWARTPALYIYKRVYPNLVSCFSSFPLISVWK